MNWNASIVRVEKQGFNNLVIVNYSNGTTSFNEELIVTNSQTANWLNDQIYARIQRLTNLDTYTKTIVPGPFTASIPTITVGTLTPAEVARNQWQTNYSLYKQMTLAVNQGYKMATDTDYVTLGQTLKTNWDPTYLDLLR